MGRLGGWDSRDHDAFLKVWTQLGCSFSWQQDGGGNTTNTSKDGNRRPSSAMRAGHSDRGNNTNNSKDVNNNRRPSSAMRPGYARSNASTNLTVNNGKDIATISRLTSKQLVLHHEHDNNYHQDLQDLERNDPEMIEVLGPPLVRTNICCQVLPFWAIFDIFLTILDDFFI